MATSCEIVRRAGGHVLPAWHWHSLAQLGAALNTADLANECIVADLSLGAWRGHWLARQWSRQLGLPEPEPVQPVLAPDAAGAARYADTVGRMIDNESLGDVNFIAAWRFARRLVGMLPERGVRCVLVVAPLPGIAWGLENVQLVKLLCDAAEDHGFVFGLLLRADAPAPQLPGVDIVLRNAPAVSPPSAPQSAMRPWCALPGLLEPAWVPQPQRWAAGIEILRLRGGQLLLSPNCRPLQPAAQDSPPRAPAGFPPGLPPGLPAWLQVPFALRCAQQDADALQREAGLRFAEGAYDLAFAILDGIAPAPLSPLQAALVAAQKQNTAIALMDFRRAAQGPLPDDSLPQVVQASLYQSKAWGLVMTGEAAAAEVWFARARTLLDPVAYARLYLYLLNISALARLRLGQPAQALAFEKDIETRLRAMARPDWHLIYINCLNQARIYKKLGDYVQAQQYYARGFHVTHGLRNESDLLYTNLCLAQLDDLQGQHAQAFVHWLRTVLHWLSNPVPEALAPRVAQAVLGRPLSNREADVEHISATLAAHLAVACERAGIAAPAAGRCIPLHRIAAGHQPYACIGQPGWSVMLAERDAGPLPFDGAAYRALNRQTGGLLTVLAPQADWERVQAILTDDQCGIELPASPRDMAWSCLRWQVPALQVGGRSYRIADGGADMPGGFVVERSRAVDAIDADGPAWQVHFRRYLAPLALAPEEQACLAQLDRPRTLAELAGALGHTPAACRALVERMAARRLLAVT